MRIAITGKPGVGKTTMCLKATEFLKSAGVKVGGIVTKEIRRGRMREGFVMIDISTWEEKILAHVNGKGPKIGKYRVFVENIDSFAVPIIEKALDEADFVIIDEIGPMELLSKRFFEIFMKAIRSEKSLLFTIHHKKVSILEDLDVPVTLLVLTKENRAKIWNDLRNLLAKFVCSL